MVSKNKNIESRLRRIEDGLGMGEKAPNKAVVILSFSRYGDKSVTESLGPIEQWETYKQVIAQNPDEQLIVFRADSQLEIEARKRPLTQSESAGLLVQPKVT
jgi:hypothetical protein